MRTEQFMSMKEKKEKNIEDETAPTFVSALSFGLAVPHSYWLYSLIWNDPCSDAFIYTY